MSVIDLGQNDFLEYNAQYRVLICRTCQYAIQKSAIRSHLLRHKIYRGERQTLLSRIARLELLEPEQVSLPPRTTPAIHGLPIISGHRCTTPGCEKLCSSVKRMRAHWTEDHGLAESNSSSLILSRSVKLQTFFRGTKIRYFEVGSLVGFDSTETTSGPGSHPVHNVSEVSYGLSYGVASDQRNNRLNVIGIARRADKDEGARDVTLSSTSDHEISDPQDDEGPIVLDLEAMAYFYHFITTTSTTLPLTEQQQYDQQSWQSQAVSLSLQHRGLMYGLLAIAATHRASLAISRTEKLLHTRKAERYCDRFAQFDAWQMTAFRQNESIESQRDLPMWASRVRGVISCRNLLQARKLGRPAEDVPNALQNLLQVIRDLAQPAAISGETVTEDAMMVFQTSMLLEGRDAEDIGEAEAAQNNTLQAMLLFLNELGPLIAEAVGKPDNVRDAFATLAAIDTLRSCCVTSFVADDIRTVWRGMSSWWIGVPDHFRNIVLNNEPAALLVLACWAGFLVRRAETCGCWFIDGMASSLCTSIRTQLPANDEKVHELFEQIQALYRSMAV